MEARYQPCSGKCLFCGRAATREANFGAMWLWIPLCDAQDCHYWAAETGRSESARQVVRDYLARGACYGLVPEK